MNDARYSNVLRSIHTIVNVAVTVFSRVTCSFLRKSTVVGKNFVPCLVLVHELALCPCNRHLVRTQKGLSLHYVPFYVPAFNFLLRNPQTKMRTATRLKESCRFNLRFGNIQRLCAL